MQSLLSPFLSSSKNASGSKSGAAIVLSTYLMVMASNPLDVPLRLAPPGLCAVLTRENASQR
jgi:hypothetical protein